MFRAGMKRRKPRSEGNSDVESSAKTDKLPDRFFVLQHYGDCVCKVKKRSPRFAHDRGYSGRTVWRNLNVSA